MNYLSVANTAKSWNVSERTVRNYCATGKIPGAVLIGKTWNIPQNAERPERINKSSKHSVLCLLFYRMKWPGT